MIYIKPIVWTGAFKLYYLMVSMLLLTEITLYLIHRKRLK